MCHWGGKCSPVLGHIIWLREPMWVCETKSCGKWASSEQNRQSVSVSCLKILRYWLSAAPWQACSSSAFGAFGLQLFIIGRFSEQLKLLGFTKYQSSPFCFQSQTELSFSGVKSGVFFWDQMTAYYPVSAYTEFLSFALSEASHESYSLYYISCSHSVSGIVWVDLLQKKILLCLTCDFLLKWQKERGKTQPATLNSVMGYCKRKL